ncbi:UDP-N-acetylmuramoyl-tripeptide--D-alanyl-D-alanine ligase, partial [Candidatus Dependentiae bacterium]|nr:UDP-N-acetylmuramoyl-tripeptide--D-alanyl-D-alanine ligase [Candidatus Dependentiae bacterium]
MKLTFKEAAELSGAYKNIPAEMLEQKINKIETDSRKVEKGDLFLAIKGENFDGHDFVNTAVKSGAGAVVVHNKINAKIPQIIVKDTVLFLGKLAEFYKSKFKIITIAVTGSCGKTTTKDMINCVLKTKFNVVTNAGSFNNHIGVPLTVFKLTDDAEILLSEVGMNHKGEIDYLSKIIKPDIAVLTNVEPVHLEGLKSMTNIANAKCELLKNLSENGTAFLNWDNEYIRNSAGKFKMKKIKYGFSKDADFTFKKYENINGMYRVKYKNEFINSPLLGFHNVYNLLITCAIAEHFKIKSSQIKSALSKFQPSGRRLKLVKHKGITIIDDCYNANPTSVSNAIKIVDDLQIKGKKY